MTSLSLCHHAPYVAAKDPMIRHKISNSGSPSGPELTELIGDRRAIEEARSATLQHTARTSALCPLQHTMKVSAALVSLVAALFVGGLFLPCCESAPTPPVPGAKTEQQCLIHEIARAWFDDFCDALGNGKFTKENGQVETVEHAIETMEALHGVTMDDKTVRPSRLSRTHPLGSHPLGSRAHTLSSLSL